MVWTECLECLTHSSLNFCETHNWNAWAAGKSAPNCNRFWQKKGKFKLEENNRDRAENWESLNWLMNGSKIPTWWWQNLSSGGHKQPEQTQPQVCIHTPLASTVIMAHLGGNCPLGCLCRHLYNLLISVMHPSLPQCRRCEPCQSSPDFIPVPGTALWQDHEWSPHMYLAMSV